MTEIIVSLFRKMNEQTSNLGEFRRQYDTNQIARYFGLILGIGFIAGGVYFLYLAFKESEPILWAVMGFCFLFTLLLGLFLIKRFRDNRGGAIKIHEKGLDITINNKRYIGTWEDFEWVKEIIIENRAKGFVVSHAYNYIAKLKNGDEFTIDEIFFGVKEVGELLQDKTAKILYPKYLQQIQNGEKVKFGDIYLDLSGITENSKTHLWSNIYGFEVEYGNIEVYPQFGKAIWKGNFANIPNSHIFIKILEHFVREFDAK